MKTLLTAALVTGTLLLSGCGYKLGEVRPTAMRSVRTLSVPNFKNDTYKPRLESLFADTVIKRLQQDGTYRIVNSANADAVLNCTITDVSRSSLRAVQNNVLATSEFGLTINLKYTIIDQARGTQLMSGTATGKSSFFSGNDIQTIERQAMSDAAADLANNLAAQITEGW